MRAKRCNPSCACIERRRRLRCNQVGGRRVSPRRLDTGTCREQTTWGGQQPFLVRLTGQPGWGLRRCHLIPTDLASAVQCLGREMRCIASGGFRRP